MKDTKIFGAWTFTTVTLLGRLKITVSAHFDNLPKLIICSSAAKKSLELQMVHIYFDTSTFDRVEKDVKVTWKLDLFKLFFLNLLS